MADPQPQSLRRLLLTHELAFLVLVIVAGLLGGVWAFFWQQTSAESIRLNGLAHVAQEIRSDLFRQINEVALARMREDPAAEGVYSAYTKSIKSGFNHLRQRSVSRAEGYAIQALQQAYSAMQVDLKEMFNNPYMLNRIVRSKLLDPGFEQALVGDFEIAFRNFRGLINQQLDDQSVKIKRWTQFAPFVIPFPIVVAVILLLFSRASLMRGFVRPVQSVVVAIRRMSYGTLSITTDHNAVAEVGEIARGIVDMAAELKRSRDALIDNERQAALGALVPVVAHNIRNPLASIRASAQLLDHERGVEDLQESQNSIILTVDRLERWVSSLVSYLHPLKPRTKLTDGVLLMDAPLALLHTRLKDKSIDVQYDPWDKDARVDADPNLIEQAFYAVVSNAIDASSDNARIVISVLAVDNQVLFGIEDWGGGIPFVPEPTGLEPGPTTKRMGTGLGIPFAFKVCKAHGWAIDYDIVEGTGTKVIVTAPRMA